MKVFDWVNETCSVKHFKCLNLLEKHVFSGWRCPKRTQTTTERDSYQRRKYNTPCCFLKNYILLWYDKMLSGGLKRCQKIMTIYILEDIFIPVRCYQVFPTIGFRLELMWGIHEKLSPLLSNRLSFLIQSDRKWVHTW